MSVPSVLSYPHRSFGSAQSYDLAPPQDAVALYHAYHGDGTVSRLSNQVYGGSANDGYQSNTGVSSYDMAEAWWWTDIAARSGDLRTFDCSAANQHGWDVFLGCEDGAVEVAQSQAGNAAWGTITCGTWNSQGQDGLLVLHGSMDEKTFSGTRFAATAQGSGGQVGTRHTYWGTSGYSHQAALYSMPILASDGDVTVTIAANGQVLWAGAIFVGAAASKKRASALFIMPGM